MASEKAMYWVAVAVLGFGMANGFFQDHGEWATRLADRSLAMMEDASETAMRYATLADITLDNDGRGRTQMALVRAQASLACLQGTLARRQAEVARMPLERVRVRVMEYVPRAIVCPRQSLAIDMPQHLEHGTF